MIGKSALVFDLYRAIASNNGVFMYGKVDCTKTEPYAALIEAIKCFCEDLFLNDKITIANYKARIIEAVGEEGKLLTCLMPNLESVIGEQSYYSNVYGQDAKNRFNYVFIKLIKAICSFSPVVLVLEDLQWMDSECLELIKALVMDKSIKNLMLVCVFRDNEVGDDHPLSQLLRDMKDMNINFSRIKTDNLDHETVNQFVSDTLCLPPIETYSLTALLHKKTGGNAFFLTQMLRSFVEEGLISFCKDNYKWTWDENKFGMSDLSKNVKELLREKIMALDEQTKTTLKAACVIGSPFSLSSLKLIVNSSRGIEGALNTGMITHYKGSDTMYVSTFTLFLITLTVLLEPGTGLHTMKFIK